MRAPQPPQAGSRTADGGRRAGGRGEAGEGGLLLGLGVQGLALFGTSHGAHAGFATALGLNTAF